MRFRNGLRLLIENFKNVYRLLLFKIVVTLVAFALCCSFVLPELIELANQPAIRALWQDLAAFGKAFVAMHIDGLPDIRDKIFAEGGSMSAALQEISTMKPQLLWTFVGCLTVYLLKRFVDTLGYFAVGDIVDDKMATYSETSFFSALIANLGKAGVYAVIYVPLSFLFDILIGAICYFMLVHLNVLISLPLTVTFVILMQAVKFTLTGHWLPAMTTDKIKLRDAFRYREEREKKQRSKIFATYLVGMYLVLIVNVLALLCTFGSAWLISVPASFVFLLCLQYVNYYTIKGKKYFITYERIARNTDFGDSEHFFNYIEEE